MSSISLRHFYYSLINSATRWRCSAIPGYGVTRLQAFKITVQNYQPPTHDKSWHENRIHNVKIASTFALIDFGRRFFKKIDKMISKLYQNTSNLVNDERNG